MRINPINYTSSVPAGLSNMFKEDEYNGSHVNNLAHFAASSVTISITLPKGVIVDAIRITSYYHNGYEGIKDFDFVGVLNGVQSVLISSTHPDLLATAKEYATNAQKEYDSYILKVKNIYPGNGNNDLSICRLHFVGRDIAAPIFNYEGDKAIELKYDDVFELPNVTVSDNIDTNIPCSITITKDDQTLDFVDTSVPGIYKILYTAVDTSGNSSNLEIIVTVLDQADSVNLLFYKTLKAKLPSSINSSKDEIHFTEDGGIYISKKDGTLLRCGDKGSVDISLELLSREW